MNLDFKNKLKAFEKEILYANACNDCYFKMKYGDKSWESVYSIAPGFFNLVIKGMQNESFLTISKLFESENRSHNNFHKLLNYVQANAKVIEPTKVEELNDVVNNYRMQIEDASIIAEKILHVRDKIIAHNDKMYFGAELKEKFNIELSYEEVCDLLKLAGDIINSLNRVLYDSITHMHYSNADDIEHLMYYCLKNMVD